MEHRHGERYGVERRERRREQVDEAAASWPGLGSITDAQMKGSIAGIVLGAVVGALIFLPFALLPWGGIGVGARIAIAALCGALAGGVALAVYLGGREPEREGEVTGTEGTEGTEETEGRRGVRG